MSQGMHASWKQALANEFKKTYFTDLVKYITSDRRDNTVFPPSGMIFHAFDLPLEDVRVVILGQDPYHNAGQAHGLSFSVPADMPIPPSLRNIYKEACYDLGWAAPPAHGCLEAWVRQGVFLLNTVLTVRAHEPGSHRGMGWEAFTDAVIRALDARQEPMVFILWGKDAQSKRALLDTTRHAVIASPHPSPMSAHTGFFGSRPFSRANEALEKMGQSPVRWWVP